MARHLPAKQRKWVRFPPASLFILVVQRTASDTPKVQIRVQIPAGILSYKGITNAPFPPDALLSENLLTHQGVRSLKKHRPTAGSEYILIRGLWVRVPPTSPMMS